MLREIDIHLKAITTERRRKIEAAAAKSQCRSLVDIESEFREYVPFMHLTRLSLV